MSKKLVAALAAMLATSTVPALADQAAYDLLMTITLDFFGETDWGPLARKLVDDPKPKDDYAAAQKFVSFCADTPAAKMPRIALVTCQSFDDWQTSYLTYGRATTLAAQKLREQMQRRQREAAGGPEAAPAATKAIEETPARATANASATGQKQKSAEDWRVAKPANDWKVSR